MKATNEDIKLFSEIVKKHNLTKESFLMRIFKRKLSKQLKNDKNLQQAIKDGDKQIEDLKKAVKYEKKKDIKSHHMLKIPKVRNYKWQTFQHQN